MNKVTFHEIRRGHLYKSGYCDNIEMYMLENYEMNKVTSYRIDGVEYSYYHFYDTDDFIVVKRIGNIYTLYFRDEMDMQG